MKNLNKVRTYGRKEVYFTNLEKVQKFIDLYEDLFVKSSWAEKEGYKYVQVDTNKGVLYKLMFLMDHDRFREIEKDLEIKRRKVVKRYENWKDENSSIRFVG